MQITDNSVVQMNYTLKNDTGEVLDTSENRGPLTFIAGKGMIIPGLEKALMGKEAGDELDVSIEPGEAYGEYQDEKIIQVGKDQFQGDAEISVGMQVQAHNRDGSTQVLTIKDIEGDDVTLDANHPLAGENLHFNVTIEDVREATEEELKDGFAR